jgi:hypothetical protein
MSAPSTTSNAQERETLLARVNEVIRVLRLLDTLRTGSPREAANHAVQAGIRAYKALHICQRSVALSPDEAANIRYVLDRLREHLQTFGEPV